MLINVDFKYYFSENSYTFKKKKYPYLPLQLDVSNNATDYYHMYIDRGV